MNPRKIFKIAQFITEDPDLFNDEVGPAISDDEPVSDEEETEDSFTDRKSFLGDKVYYGVLGIIQQELAKYDCKLDRHRKRPHTTGMDVDLTVKCTKDPKKLQELRDKLEESMPYKKWDFDNKPSAYVLAAINPDVDERVSQEYGLDYLAHQWSGSDIVTLTVSKPRPEFKPEPGGDFEMGGPEMGMEDLSLGPEKGQEEPEDELELGGPDLGEEEEEEGTENPEELSDDELLGIRAKSKEDEEESEGLEY